MPTKTKTPDELRAQAEQLAEQAAEVQAEIDAQSIRAWEAEQAEQRKADQKYVDTFDAAAIDDDVEQAYDRLKQVVAESPIVQAQATYIAAQNVRNHAHLDLTSARSRLGLPNATGRQAGSTDVNPQELIDATTQRMTDEIRAEKQA